jgi:hypothetical protein
MRESMNLEGGLPEPDIRQAWPVFLRQEILFDALEKWRAAGLLKTGFLPEQYAKFVELRAALEGKPRPAPVDDDRIRVETMDFLLACLPLLRQRNEFTSYDAERRIAASLQARRAELAARLRQQAGPAPVPAPPTAPAPQPVLAAPPSPTAAARPAAAPASTPAEPFMQRFWRAILSERTLHALLFLGIFLVFAAAISFVIWGWKDFAKLARVATVLAFTGFFFLGGWFVRTRTTLSRSGIALSAIAALLVPINCYTVYANYGSPPDGWPLFWLLTSLACVGAYILSTLRIQSRFFGYLTATALGSTVMAINEYAGLARDWWPAGLSILAAGMILTATGISRHPDPKRWKAFTEPFRYIGLLLPGVLMPLTVILRLLHGGFGDLHYAMTATWFLGGFIFAWGAIRYRSRGLGMLAAAALPFSVYMVQAAIFHDAGINPAWQAFGLSLLTPLYLLAGHRLRRPEDEVLRAHGRTTLTVGIALMATSAIVALTDLASGASAAATYIVLAGSAVLGAVLWERPASLYAASFFAFFATMFGMSELDLGFGDMYAGWTTLALTHILMAVWLGRSERGRRFLAPLVVAGYAIAAIAILPPLVIYDGSKLTYPLFNWLALSAWGAWLAHHDRPGFVPAGREQHSHSTFLEYLLGNHTIYHWLTAIVLPFWLWDIQSSRHLAAEIWPLVLAGLAWAMVFLGHRLSCANRHYRLPWRFTGLAVAVVSLMTAGFVPLHEFILPVALLSAGLLCFADTLSSRQAWQFYPAALFTGIGLWLLLVYFRVDREIVTFSLCLLTAAYFSAGLLYERTRSPQAGIRFLGPLYHVAHLAAFVVALRVAIRPLDDSIGGPEWTQAIQVWGAVDLLILAVYYGLFAWARYREVWAYFAAWLGMAGGMLLVFAYSHGQGSSATKGALVVVLFILAERALYALRMPLAPARLGERFAAWAAAFARRLRLPAHARLAWGLFHRPLQFTGWVGSAGVIFVLALLRNLVWLGGGRIQQTWAAIGLLIITALYALSARMYRQARFAWFAALLVFIPWTILTNLDWFTAWNISLPGFGAGWVVLAWLLYLASLPLERRVPRAYVAPLRTVTHVLLPFSMLWAAADAQASLYTVGLSIGLYGVAAWQDHLRARKDEVLSPLSVTRFLYPAISLLPVWAVYWLDFLQPAARHEHYGLLILAFGVVGIAAGQGLERIAPRPGQVRAYGLPAYLTGYLALIAGTLLTAHIPGLLAMALLYDALLLAISAWIFRSAFWVFPSAGLGALSLLVALGESGIPVERRGWWLLGLAATYLGIAWLLRRCRLVSYGNAILAIGFVLIAASLPPSSQDQTGALWGYTGAALLYALSAIWLRQPLLLTPACALIVVPYAVEIDRLNIDPAWRGTALFPGAILALGLAWLLDRRLGDHGDFPWDHPSRWMSASAERLLHWWALPLYALGFGLATLAPIFNASHPGMAALDLGLLMLVYVWAIFRFRQRFWLLAATLAGHLAVGYLLERLGWWDFPWKALTGATGEAWLRYLPVTVVTLALAVFVEKYFKEGPPFRPGKLWPGWSRPLYLFFFFDLLLAQFNNFDGTLPSMTVTLIHAGLAGVLASLWLAPWQAYGALGLGAIALLQWREALHYSTTSLPIHFAALALGYGLLGFGYQLHQRHQTRGPEGTGGPPWLGVWMHPLQRSALAVSILSLILAPAFGIRLISWTVAALFGQRQLVETETIWMIIWVLSLNGLFYTAASAAWQRLRVGYFGIALLLAGWFTYAYHVRILDGMRQLQWYALPAGLYLLGISYLEWKRGNHALGRWLDYLAVILMIASLFAQTLEFGPLYAISLGAEGFALWGWGVVRRLRRFFYAGLVGMMLAAIGQLINSLQEINQWIVYGGIGLLLILAALVVERNLERIKAWQEDETWE